MYFNQAKQGFTLIELLVVVLIIGILAAVALPQYKQAVLKSKFTQLEMWVNALTKGVELYYLANGIYPNDVRDLDIDIIGNGEVKPTHITAATHQGVVYPNGIECAVFLSGTGSLVYCMDDNFSVAYYVRTGDIYSDKRFCRGKNILSDKVCQSKAVGNGLNEGLPFLKYPIE